MAPTQVTGLTQDHLDVIRAMEGIYPDGRTAMGDGLQLGMDLLRQSALLGDLRIGSLSLEGTDEDYKQSSDRNVYRMSDKVRPVLDWRNPGETQ